MPEEKPAMSKEECADKGKSHIKPHDYVTQSGKAVHVKGTCRKKKNAPRKK
jgi:hypothetical protein